MAVRNYFETFKKFNIIPIIIFNGSYGDSNYEEEKHERRHNSRKETIKRYLNGEDITSFAPINHYEVFKDILLEKGIAHAQCDYGGDEQIAALAKEYECPVLSEDSDFYIYDLPHGFIRFSNLDRVLKEAEDTGTMPKNCELYRVQLFLKTRSIKDRSLLSLFAALLGNDYSTLNDFKIFYNNKKINYENRFIDVLTWLQKYTTVNSAKRDILMCYKGKSKTVLSDKIDYIIKSYEFTQADGVRMSNILKGISSNCSTDITTNSRISTPCGKPWPDQLVVAFHKCLISSTLLNIFTTRHSYLHGQIEVFSKPSSYTCSRNLRKITYSILSMHEADNVMIQCKKCQCDIREHDRSIHKVYLKLNSKLKIGNSQIDIPSLSDVYEGQNDYRVFIAIVFGITIDFFEDIPEHLKLLFGCIVYWLLNSDPKPKKEFLFALLISIVYSEMKGKNIQENINKKAPSVERLSPTLTENFEKYLQEPNEFRVSDVSEIIHSYSQLQTCIWSIASLNAILKRPFVSSKLSECLNGTMLCNLTKEVQSVPKLESIINLLKEENDGVDLFSIYKRKIIDIIKLNYFQ